MKRMTLLISILLLFITGEFILRGFFGFTDAVLFLEDPQVEYLAQPSQDRHRFGNSIRYNEFSMRTEPFQHDACKILGLGDSILNGGVLCDQEALATYLLEKKISKETGKNYQVLNISAPSWGPDNAMAYLEKFGNFNAELIFLVTSSHDAYDTMDFVPIVGKSENYPEKQYNLAYLEGVNRYFLPWLGKRFKGKKEATGGFEDKSMEKIFNPGFQDILEYTNSKKIPFLLYLHPELSEVRKGSYNKKGQLILEFARENNIRVISGLTRAQEDHYLDNIHLNEKGQKNLYEQLYPNLKEIVFQ